MQPLKTALIPIVAMAFAVPAFLHAAESQAQAGYYRFTVGDVRVTSLSDGTVRIPAPHLLHTAKPEEVKELLAAGYASPEYPASVNAYLLELPGHLVLVDAGTAELYGPTLGKLPTSLRNAGFSPDQITDIFLTHIHTDHSGGLVQNGKRVFPNAVVHVEERELDYWMNPANETSVPAYQKRLFTEAAAKIPPYQQSGQIKTFHGPTEFFPGFRAIPAPGHTPGHTFYSLESNGEKIVFWGDIVHVAEVQLVDPAVTIEFDTDEQAAAAQREKAFADAAAKGYLIAPAHVAFPGVGHLRKDGAGYRWIPLVYLNDAH